MTDRKHPLDPAALDQVSGGVITGSSGANRLTGTGGADNFDAGYGADTIMAYEGNDTVRAGHDNDSVSGGSGSDSIDGGEGTDQLYGGVGNDNIAGGGGADLIVGGLGHDSLMGDGTLPGSVAGDDQFLWKPGEGSDTIDGGGASDTLILQDTGLSLQQVLAAINETGGTARIVGNAIDLTGVSGSLTIGNETIQFRNLERLMLGSATWNASR
jgi:Ca2+-binding RTX toxin-like protein